MLALSGGVSDLLSMTLHLLSYTRLSFPRRVLGVVNPLLVAETVQSTRGMAHLMKRIAAVALRQYKHEVDTDFDMESNSLSVKLVKVILQGLFDSWDKTSVGYLTPVTFAAGCEELGINWGVQQRREVFNTLDRHQHDGQVFFEEFFAAVAPHLSRMVDELQGHQPEKNEWTPNLNEVFEFLEEAHKRTSLFTL